MLSPIRGRERKRKYDLPRLQNRRRHGYIDSLAEYIQRQFPGIRGFNRRGLYRMKQFYEAYSNNEKVSALLTQLSWTNHLLIMSGSKSDEERGRAKSSVKENAGGPVRRSGGFG